jgi:hypothetical protein
MKSISKLFSLMIISYGIALTTAPVSAYAEYYMVYAPEPCCAVEQPVYHAIHYHHHHYHSAPHHRHHHRHYWAPYHPRSTYSISVYYTCPTYGCCSSWAPCMPDCAAGLCGRPYQVYYEEPVARYKETCAYTDSCADETYVNDEQGIDLDRRTADDVGSDMDIDN